MTAKNERLSVLKMIESGRLNAEEGLALLEAMDPPRQVVPGRKANDARRVRVLVTELGTGRRKSEINVPVSMVDLVLRLAARVAGRRAEGSDGRSDVECISETVRRGSTGRVLDLADEIEDVHLEVFVE